MKKLIIIIAMYFVAMLPVSVWSHDAAEGIVSDEIWLMVDQLLVKSNSPHLLINLAVVPESTGRTTEISVLFYQPDLPDGYLAEFVADVTKGIATITRLNEARSSNVNSEIDVRVVDGELDDTVLVVITEQVGVGKSQSMSR